MRSALERFVPACPVIDFGRPWIVVVVRGAIIESGCVLDTAAEAVGVKGVCSVASVGRGTF